MKLNFNSHYKKSSLIGIILLAISFQSCLKSDQNNIKADVIIYGGTSSAVIAAVEVARSGKTVIIVSPDVHLGGLTAGGLGWTDTGKKETIGGLARNFYHRVYNHYEQKEAWKWMKKNEYGNTGQGTPAIDGDKRTMWIFEPHVAEKVFEEMVAENDIQIFRDEWLDRKNGMEMNKGKITSIMTLSGKTFHGKMFMDATYEGDLMASAGISYHVGREGKRLLKSMKLTRKDCSGLLPMICGCRRRSRKKCKNGDWQKMSLQITGTGLIRSMFAKHAA